MSTDERRMALVGNELSRHIDRDTCSLIIDFARYTETELVWIALQDNLESRKSNSSTVYRVFRSEFYVYDSDDPPGVFGGYNRDNYKPLLMWISYHPQCYPELTLSFGTPEYSSDIQITIDDLLPSVNMETINVPYDDWETFYSCRPMYINCIRSEMDVI